MTRVLALAGLLALQFVLGNCGEDEETTNFFSPGDTMKLAARETDEKVSRCLITTNENITYEFYPKNEFGSYSGYGGSCFLNAGKTLLSYAGVWRMETFVGTQSFTSKFIVKIIETVFGGMDDGDLLVAVLDNMARVTMKPTHYISATTGQFVTVWIDSAENSNLTACKLKIRRRKEINLMTENVDNITRTHGCGVRIFLVENMDGELELTAHFEDYLIKTASLQIRIPETFEHTEMIQEHFNVGQRGSLKVGVNGVSLCRFTRPDGKKMPFIPKGCVHDISSFNALHNGVWTVSFSKADTMKRLHMKINVTVTDPNFIDCSSTHGNNSVNLMCKSGSNNLKFCIFIRPDQEIINVPAGIGNEKYSYHGIGYGDNVAANRRHSECGLTIQKPSSVDFGQWICQMGVNEEIRSGIINIENSRLTERVRVIASPRVIVKRGDNFTIQCSTNAVLNYCWLIDPTGSVYSVSPTGSSDKNLKYDGKGFIMGECGAIVENAADTHNGDWTCHLGIKNAAEVAATVSVKVTDTYLIAAEETVLARKLTTLSSRTFRDDEGPIEYCRWVRPNGHGINEAEASHYSFRKGTRDCSLTILSPASDDIGQWRCAALLSGNSGKEEWSTIELKSADENNGTSIASILSIVLGSGLLVVTLIGAFFATMHFYKKRNSRLIKKPPPYCPEDYAIPPQYSGRS